MKLSPVHVPCEPCGGHGRLAPDWRLCPSCDGIGRTWAPGAPSYGLKDTLAKHKRGEVVTLGNGDRGRIVRQVPANDPVWTDVTLIGFFDGSEDTEPTEYPSCVGVASALPTHEPDRQRGRGDPMDPLQRRAT